MKKSLVLVPSMLFSFMAFSQSNLAKPAGVINVSQKLANKFRPNEALSPTKPNPSVQVEIPSSEDLKTVNTTAATWAIIAGSRNIFGVLESITEPLHWNDNLNAVSFVHRASATYTGQPSTPGTESGAIVAEISTNWGSTWDSTCFFSDVSMRGRYPQGAIYNPPGNSSLANAYIVGSGPITDGAAWVASWYASKSLAPGNFNATASSTPGAMQLVNNNPPYPAWGKSDYATYGFGVTDDGKAKAMAIICNDINGTSNVQFGIRGAMLVKGTFNAGVFNWTGDSMCPATVVRTDGSKQMWSSPVMAWNESGTIGYIVQIGAAATATGSNKGWQPIIYKTTNSGVSWAPVSGINFNDPAFNSVKASLPPTNANPSLKIPFFKIDEGWDAVVDNSGKLHIVSTIVGTSSNHNDSLEYTYQYGTEMYSWNHTPGQRPYLYDFIGDGASPWTFRVVDSLSTEGPGDNSGEPGFNDNPWDIDGGSKVRSHSRIMASRSTDGTSILFTWAESDTNFTTGAKKWNTLPNIKARAMNANTYSISPTEINVTKPVTGANPNVANRAMFHYTAPEFSLSCSGNSTTIRVPMTISNSNPYGQVVNNRHWYSAASLDFASLNCIVGLKENLSWNVNSMEIYPNPAKEQATMSVDAKEKGNATIEVYNMIGQLVKSQQLTVNEGSNNLSVDLTNISAGVYLVKFNLGATTSSKKLIVE